MGYPDGDAFSKRLKDVWIGRLATSGMTKKELLIAKVGEKLVWILTLLVVGLEIEATDPTYPSSIANSKDPCKEYSDAAKSVSKILLDFVSRHFYSPPPSSDSTNPPTTRGKNRRQPAHITLPSGKGGVTANAISRQFKVTNKKHQQMNMLMGKPYGSLPPDSPLLRIGDVLHRTQTFLADPHSPPAALLRGEVIALLCDVLDLDTNMELSDVETASSPTNTSNPVNDLGSAGSLLKLIVLNCATMRSSSCTSANLHKVHAGNRFLAVVHRLAASRSTAARITACSLGPVLWSHLDFPHQLQLRGVITRALHDVEVIVRKSTAGVLHEIAELVFDPRAVPWLVLMCERAMTDPEPQLRSAAMTLTWHLAEHLPNAFLGDASKGSRSLSRLPDRNDPTFAEVYLLQCKLLPVATRLAEDRAPSVRLAVAAQCDRLSDALGEHWFSVIIDMLQALLADSDEEVRSEATLCLPRLVESVIMISTKSVSASISQSRQGRGVLEALLPVAIKLLKDPSPGVRVSLATSAGELLTLLVNLDNLDIYDGNNDENDARAKLAKQNSKEELKQHKRHIDETLIPLVQRLLHDSDPEVTSAALVAVTNASRGNVRNNKSHTNKSNSNLEKDKDQQNDHADKNNKPVFVPVLDENQVLRLLPTLSDLATSPQWRVRQSAVEIVPALLLCTDKLETRQRIAQLCVQLMGDTVDAVRKTAAECLCLGGGALGATDGNGVGDDEDSLRRQQQGEWVRAIVIPHLKKCGESKDWKQRILCLKMVFVIIKHGGLDVHGDISVEVPEGEEDKTKSVAKALSPTQDILKITQSLITDSIVNVRLNVGRVLGMTIHSLDENVDDLKYVITILEEQLQEEKKRQGGGDRDVLYFAGKALREAQDIVQSHEGNSS
mmetsp:Transcript_9046/g.11111  ORF Transcript_9046/g.11111 Transcript_9046/m.11111 type:complete len:894 (+) Transcript_9046:1-2682(+)